MPRSTTTTYLGNPKLKSVGVKQSYTMKEFREYQKCSADPIYFINNYVKIVNLDQGEILFKMYPFQEEMVRNFMDNRFSIVKCPRQVGKCLVENTGLNIRNRATGEEKYVTIREFFFMHKHPIIYKVLSALQSCFGLRRR